jgi:capsular exopolysaccharide synthesis family protein
MIADLIRSQNQAKGLQQQASQLQSQINKLNAELKSITANQARLSDLQRRYDIAEGIYKGIIAQSEQSKTSSPFDIYPHVQTIDAPTIADPTRPKDKLAAFGGILAAIFGSMALVALLENRNPLLKPKDLQQLELPVLASIPRIKRPDERDLGADAEIEFQRLASAILMHENQCLMVTSATSGEGKTTVTLGLALALVNFGFRVLIVDGDLRQAGMSRRLSNTLEKSKANANQTPISIYSGLDLLPAPSIPKNKVAEFFAHGSFERSLNTIRKSGSYDYVLVDSPPVSLASETNLISAVVCNVLFVVRSGTSDRYPVLESLEQLIRHNARIMGLVVNGAESRTESYRYGYGRQRELLETEV